MHLNDISTDRAATRCEYCLDVFGIRTGGIRIYRQQGQYQDRNGQPNYQSFIVLHSSSSSS
jgi:hypothetical protein